MLGLFTQSNIGISNDSNNRDISIIGVVDNQGVI